MKESQFRRKLLDSLRKTGALVRAIETGGTVVGFPDVYYCHDGVVALIELKNMTNIEGPCTSRKVPFRPGQYSFLKRNKQMGGYSFVGIAYRNGYAFYSITDIDETTERPLHNGLFMEKLDGTLIDFWLTLANKKPNVHTSLYR
jgi:Holliday junction resolvase